MRARSTETDVRSIDASVERALRALVEVTPGPQPGHLALGHVSWGGVAAPGIDRIGIDADGSLRLEAPPPADSAFAVSPENWQPGCFVADVLGHGPLVVQQGASSLLSVTCGQEESKVVAQLKGWRWHAAAEADGTKLWAAPLRFKTGKPPIVLWQGHGNMLLAVGQDLVRGWRFGTARGPGFLVPSGDTWYLAISAEDRHMPDASFVQFVAGVIGFVFGEPFDIGMFQPFGDRGALPGFAHLGLPTHVSKGAALQPPALPFDCSPSWVAGFVEAILAFADSRPEAPILKAIHLYFASLNGYTESKFLHAWIALESLARWGVEDGCVIDDRPKRIADHDAWLQWVDSRRHEIEALAVPGMANRLLSRVQSAECDRPTVVHGAFRGMGIDWTPAMADAEQVRHGVAHEGAMSQDARDWNRDRSRIGLVKTMLVAFIARLVGYYGPIADRSRTCFRLTEQSEPDWWRAVGPFRSIDYHGGSVGAILAKADAVLESLEREHTQTDA